MPHHPLLPVIAAAVLCSALPAAAQPAQGGFPEGPGKDTFVALCGGCHDINRARAGYTPEGWHTVMRMMHNFGRAVSEGPGRHPDGLPDQELPRAGAAAAVIVDGPVKAKIKQWQVPTPGSRPHDPLAAKDGAIWYTGNCPASSAASIRRPARSRNIRSRRRRPVRTASSRTRTATSGSPATHAARSASSIPRPATVTEYKMPDPEGEGSAHLAIDQSGIVWFTGSRANMVGRIDPKTGEVKLVTSPTPKSRPYGCDQLQGRAVLRASSAPTRSRPSIPKTMDDQGIPLPNAASRPRRLALTPDDAVWYADFSRGYLGRLDLATGETRNGRRRAAAIAALRHRRGEGRHLVQRIFAKPNTMRALRSEDGEVPELGDPRRR
jgi:virginiamycin B lyase